MKTKQNLSKQTVDDEILAPLLETLRQDAHELKVPAGYFDSLGPRIIDGIHKKENKSLFEVFFPSFRKPFVWAPIMATALVAAFLLFMIPAKKDPSATLTDEWTDINMVYDVSYADEALLAESYIIENEIENNEVGYIQSASFTGVNEPTTDEITRYLKEQDMDTEILNEY